MQKVAASSAQSSSLTVQIMFVNNRVSLETKMTEPHDSLLNRVSSIRVTRIVV